jgi:hypothetical protein
MRRKTHTRKRSVVWLKHATRSAPRLSGVWLRSVSKPIAVWLKHATRSALKPIDVWLKHVTRSALRLSGVWLLRCSGA